MITGKETAALLRFIDESPTAFHAVENIAGRLEKEGFVRLREEDQWAPEAGKGYFVTRNHSSIIAFRMPERKADRFLIAASHTDSPMFKLKNNALSPSAGAYLRLNTEVYGGTILSSWLDRPLSVAGRVILSENGKFTTRLVNIDRDLLVIPNVAIHFNRTVNSGYAYNPAVDLLPVFSEKPDGSLNALIADALGCGEDRIAGADLFVYNRARGTVIGADGEFFMAPRIDNLMCAHGTLSGFLRARTPSAVTVYYAADNEETGSATKQGAASVFLSDVLDRICESTEADKRRALASSMMVSADNGHAKHPNHPELSDAQNAPYLNRGVVIKTNAAQKYTTDGISAAVFSEICQRAKVPVQWFANRSDMPGGSTLGSISNTQVPLMTVDIGMAQLAMHSACETAGSADPEFLADAMKAFYSSELSCSGDGSFTLS